MYSIISIVKKEKIPPLTHSRDIAAEISPGTRVPQEFKNSHCVTMNVLPKRLLHRELSSQSLGSSSDGWCAAAIYLDEKLDERSSSSRYEMVENYSVVMCRSRTNGSFWTDLFVEPREPNCIGERAIHLALWFANCYYCLLRSEQRFSVDKLQHHYLKGVNPHCRNNK